MNAKQLAQLTGTSVRTLHHYDEIGLLCPRRNGENGYREYSEEDLDTLQQILFFKECGFALSEIKKLLQSPSFDRLEAFELQRKSLLYQKERIEAMLETLEKSVQHLKGEKKMSTNEKFAGLDMVHNPYEAEARERWGDKAVDKSNAYLKKLGKEGQKDWMQKFESLFQKLGTLRGEDPAGAKAQEAMQELYTFFNTQIGHQYTPEMFAGLGRMYVEDERFTKNIDKYGDGLAAFLAKAMPLYADSID